MRKEKEKLNCKVILTNEEMLNYGKAVAAINSKKVLTENGMKTFVAQKKAEIAECEATISRLSEIVNNGYEYREVECRIHYDWESKTKTWFRADTGEIEKTSIISESEMQEYLDV